MNKKAQPPVALHPLQAIELLARAAAHAPVPLAEGLRTQELAKALAAWVSVRVEQEAAKKAKAPKENANGSARTKSARKSANKR